MQRVELFIVQNTFCLSERQMLILHPDFSVPKNWKQRDWNNREESVLVVSPDGLELEASARIYMTHYNIPGPDVSIDQRWRITIALKNKTKEEVPLGSKIFVSKEVKAALV